MRIFTLYNLLNKKVDTNSVFKGQENILNKQIRNYNNRQGLKNCMNVK